jgi:hypothetical protein
MDVCREEFQKWAERHFNEVVCPGLYGHYTDAVIHAAWQGWEASWKWRSERNTA